MILYVQSLSIVGLNLSRGGIKLTIIFTKYTIKP